MAKNKKIKKLEFLNSDLIRDRLSAELYSARCLIDIKEKINELVEAINKGVTI